MTEPLVSVIIPVYNLRGHIGPCLRSVRGQTFGNLEILLVDDGSTDGSAELCEELAAEDARIRVIRRENGGVSAARNTGLEEAKGDLVAFVDGDDAVAPDYIARLTAPMEEGVILSVCGHARITGYDRPLPEGSGASAVYPAEACAERLLRGRFPVGAWGCVFRRSGIGDLRFAEGVRNNEDKLFLYSYLMRDLSGKVAVTDDPLYGYYVREGSAARTAWNGSLDRVWVADRIEELTAEKRPQWSGAAKNAAIGARHEILKSIVRSGAKTPQARETWSKMKREILGRGWPRGAGSRLKLESFCLRAGKPVYTLLVKTFYGITSDDKRFKTNEKQIRQTH